MPISTREMEVGYLYRTINNQERVILEINQDKVKYASRGGNVKNEFEQMDKSSLDRFANACSERIKKLSDTEFLDIKKFFQGRNLIK